MTFSSSSSQSEGSLPEQVARSHGLFSRLALTWPLIVVPLVGFTLSFVTVQSARHEVALRQERLERLASYLPHESDIARLKQGVAQLSTVVPASALQPTKNCKVQENKETGKTSEVCQDQPSTAAVTLSQVDESVARLERSTEALQSTIRDLTLSMRDGWGMAHADDDTFPTNRDKSFMLYAIFGTLILMTLGSFYTMLTSANARAVTYAIDALKIFGGFYVGVVGSVFGLRK